MYSSVATVSLLFLIVGSVSASPNLGPLAGSTNVLDPDIPTLVYDPTSGSLSFDGPTSTITLEIKSRSANFNVDAIDATSFSGIFDDFNERKLFQLHPSGIETPVQFGMILPVGLSESDLLSDLVVDGTGYGPTYLLRVPESTSHCFAATFAALVFRPLRAKRGSY